MLFFFSILLIYSFILIWSFFLFWGFCSVLFISSLNDHLVYSFFNLYFQNVLKTINCPLGTVLATSSKCWHKLLSLSLSYKYFKISPKVCLAVNFILFCFFLVFKPMDFFCLLNLLVLNFITLKSEYIVWFWALRI